MAPDLQSLLPEILEEIFVESENLSLPLTCRRFHLLLSKSVVRLHFCTHAFYKGNPQRIKQSDFSRIVHLQTKIFAQKWFTSDFSSKVETAVLKLQEPAYQKRVAEANLRNRSSTNSWHSPGKNKVICSFGAQLPLQAVSGPWTDEKVSFLHRLMRWNAKGNIYDKDAAFQGLRDAIIQGRPDAVKLLSEPSIGVQLDHDLFRLAVLNCGCNKAIVKIFAHTAFEDDISIDWTDEKLRQWALKQEMEGDEKGTWLLQLIDSEGEEVSEDEYEFYI